MEWTPNQMFFKFCRTVARSTVPSHWLRYNYAYRTPLAALRYFKIAKNTWKFQNVSYSDRISIKIIEYKQNQRPDE